MKIIHRYVLKHFLPIFAVSVSGFVGLYLVVDFFERVDHMLEKNLPFHDIYIYFLYKIPMIVSQGIPMASILASIIALGLLKRNRELIAMETAGIKPVYYIAPIALAALCLSFFHFAVSEFAARPLNQTLDEIWEVKVSNKKPSLWMNPENMWFREENTIYQIRLYDKQHKTMEKTSIFFLDPQFRLIKRVDANRIKWNDPGWVAEDGLIIRFTGTGTEQKWFDKEILNLNVTPDDFIAGQAGPDNLSWFDLYRYTGRIEQEGFSSTPYRVDLNQRIASPFATLILALLGIIVVLKQGLHGGIAAGVGMSLALAFAFVATSNVGSALASAEILPPFLGVWAGNMIFSALVCYFWIRE